MPVTHGVRGSSPLRTASKPKGKSPEARNRKRGSLRLPRFLPPSHGGADGKSKADKGTSTSIREGGTPAGTKGGLTPERKSPKDTYPTVPGKGNNRMLRRIRPATPERKNIRRLRRIHPHPRREAGKHRTGREGAGNSTPCREARIRRRHSRTRQANGKKISRNYLQVLENIVSLHSQYQNGALVQLVRIRACHARGQGFESPYAPPANRRENPRRQKRKTRQFTTASFFIPHHGGTDGARQIRVHRRA